MPHRLLGKIAVVTGGMAGIGAASAARLAAEGATVIVADIDGDGANAQQEEIEAAGGSALGKQVDIGDEASISALFAMIADRFGRLDILFNNAADTSSAQMAGDVSIDSMDAAIWDRAFAINTRGTMLMIKHSLPLLIRSGGGSIINTSSAASLRGDLYVSAYAASKAAINCLSVYVATQFGKQGIRCNAVCPGVVATSKVLSLVGSSDIDRIAAHNLTPDVGTPADIAGLVAFLASDDARYVNGQVIAADGGFTAHAPTFAEMLAKNGVGA